jgi:hypothetical protein
MEVLESLLYDTSPCICLNNKSCNRYILKTEIDDLIDAIDADDEFQRQCDSDINSNRYR